MKTVILLATCCLATFLTNAQNYLFENNEVRVSISITIASKNILIRSELENKSTETIYLCKDNGNYAKILSKSVGLNIGWDQEKPQDTDVAVLKIEVGKKQVFSYTLETSTYLENIIVQLNYCTETAIKKKLNENTVNLHEYMISMRWEELVLPL